MGMKSPFPSKILNDNHDNDNHDTCWGKIVSYPEYKVTPFQVCTNVNSPVACKCKY